jgi:hypothetical protein
MRRSLVLALPLAALASAAQAQTLIPGPGESGYDAALEAKMDGLARVQDAILSAPIGWGLEAFVDDPADRAAIDAFVASGQRDFRAQSGMHPYEVIDLYEEQGDLGMFGGVQVAGLAWRYTVLRGSGAPAADVDAARAALRRAIEGLHWYTQVTGVPGGVARGIMRVEPEAGDPALPNPRPTTIPLFDASGNPLPAVKDPVWREDNSGELPFLVWFDDTSKDQIDGYILALGAAYDAIEGDPSFDPMLAQRLRDDARAIGHRLMERVMVGMHSLDLVLVDADGRPTSFHDLSAEEISPGIVIGRVRNGFNAIMALGMIRTLYHVSGDESIGRFYYESLVGDRDYWAAVDDTLMGMYVGLGTNFSNVNMAFVAAWGVARYETDPVVVARFRAALEGALYAPGVPREARGLGQPFFDFLYAGFREAGATDAAGMRAVSEGLATLREQRGAPYWNPAVENCDAAEIASSDCVGIDGTLLPLAGVGRGGSPVAMAPVPIRIRPPSNFEHRSDPHDVNGGGGNRLNPGADMVAAYWMGRLLRASGGDDNVTPSPRPPFAWTPRSERDAGPGSEPPPPPGGGCGCAAARAAQAPVAMVIALGLTLAWRRKR